MKLSAYSWLGLLGMASAIPTPAPQDLRVEAAAAIKVMPFGASIVEGVSDDT